MPEAKRRLAAILSADVAGYSRLMGDDERATLDTLNAYRGVFREHVDRHDGRVVDTAGDSVLAVFDSVVEAVQCAVDVQAELTDLNGSLPDNRRMRFRIGVNSGDIIEQDDGTVYGDGVNVAARLEALAEPGGIAVSETARLQAKGNLDTTFEDIGKHAVKNIAEPVQAYRLSHDDDAGRAGRRTGRLWVIGAAAAAVLVALIGIGVWQAGWLGGARGVSIGEAAQLRPMLPGGPSIAVLPLDNLSGDAEQAYLSDGLTEDIIAALGRYSDLTVLARNATIRFAGSTQSPAEIGQALGVSYLLVGSVRRGGDQIRVSAQLVDARSGQHLWSNRYDNQFEDLFSVQDDITRSVAGALAVELTRLESERAISKPPENLEAYDLVLRGGALMRQAERSAIFEARETFQRAIELDPNYAAAYAGLGETYEEAVSLGYTEFVRQNIDKAESLVKQALSLDPKSGNALRVLGLIYMHKGQLELAAQQLQRALELNPSDARNYVKYGDILLYTGHDDRAIEWFEAAFRLDPNPAAEDVATLGKAYYLSGGFETAIAHAHEAIKRDPDFYDAYVVLAASYAQLGQSDNAARAAEDVLRLRPFFTIDWYTTVYADPEHVAQMTDGLRKAGLDKTD